MTYIESFEIEARKKLSQIITSCGGSEEGSSREIEGFIRTLSWRMKESFKNGIQAEKRRGQVKVTKPGILKRVLALK